MARRRARNPYIAGRALRGGRGFFGREEILRAVREELSEPERGSIVLFGQRRIGKTSILLRLVDDLAAEGHLPIYLDLMDLAERPLGEVLHALAAQAAVALDKDEPDAAALGLADDHAGEHFLQTTLPWLYATAGSRRPVFVFDEFDDLDRAREDRLGGDAAARSFFPYLRRLMETQPQLGFVFAIGRKAGDLSIDVKALFKATRSKRVSVLQRAAAEELIRAAERNGTLAFDDAAIDRILQLTSGHPYMTQLYCQRLWHSRRRSREGEQSAAPRVEAEHVDAVLDDVLEAGQNVFDWIWEGLPAAERVILSVLAESTPDGDALDRDALEEVLQESGVRMLSHELEVAPDKLVEWDLLRASDNGYSVLVELLRLWVARRKPIATVRDELDRIVPLADAAYQTGELYFVQRDLDRAVDLLQQALRSNPNHVKARRRLVDIHIERGALAEALTELEHISRLDPPKARIPMVHVLSLQAEEHERDENEDAALEVYTRILEISPREPAALERRAQILTARGDAILQGDLSALETEDEIEAHISRARRLFEDAGNSVRLEALEARKHRLLRRVRLQRAAALEADDEWAEAVAFYTLLADHYPDDEEIKGRIGRARESRDLQLLYTQARGLADESRLDDAIRAFADLVHRAPAYSDAARRLAAAVERRKAQTRASETDSRRTSRAPRPGKSTSSAKQLPRLQAIPASRTLVKPKRHESAIFWIGALIFLELVIFALLDPSPSATQISSSLRTAGAETVTPEQHAVREIVPLGTDGVFVLTSDRLQRWSRQATGWLNQYESPNEVSGFAIDPTGNRLLVQNPDGSLALLRLDGLTPSSTNIGFLAASARGSDGAAGVKSPATLSLAESLAAVGSADTLTLWRPTEPDEDSAQDDGITRLVRPDTEFLQVLLSPSGRFLSVIIASEAGPFLADVYLVNDLEGRTTFPRPLHRISSLHTIRDTAFDPRERSWTAIGDRLSPSLYSLLRFAPPRSDAAPAPPNTSAPRNLACPGGRAVSFDPAGTQLAIVLAGDGLALCDLDSGKESSRLFDRITLGQAFLRPDGSLYADVDEEIDQVVRITLSDARSIWPPFGLPLFGVILVMVAIGGLSLFFLVPIVRTELQIDRLRVQLSALDAEQVTPESWFVRAALTTRLRQHIVVHKGTTLWSVLQTKDSKWVIKRLGSPGGRELEVRAIGLDPAKDTLTVLSSPNRASRVLRLPNFEQQSKIRLGQESSTPHEDEILCATAENLLLLALSDDSSPESHWLVSVHDGESSNLHKVNAHSLTSLASDRAGKYVALSYQQHDKTHLILLLHLAADRRTATTLGTIESASPVKALAIDPEGRFLATAFGSGSLYIYEYPDLEGREVKGLKFVTSCVVSRDSIVVGTVLNGVHMLHPKTLKTRKVILPGRSVEVLDLSDDGRWLLVRPWLLSAVFRIDLQPLLPKLPP
ncbi:MAG: tetratricopeptide repeat protein [Acidobacteriota bacterium]